MAESQPVEASVPVARVPSAPVQSNAADALPSGRGIQLWFAGLVR